MQVKSPVDALFILNLKYGLSTFQELKDLYCKSVTKHERGYVATLMNISMIDQYDDYSYEVLLSVEGKLLGVKETANKGNPVSFEGSVRVAAFGDYTSNYFFDRLTNGVNILYVGFAKKETDSELLTHFSETKTGGLHMPIPYRQANNHEGFHIMTPTRHAQISPNEQGFVEVEVTQVGKAQLPETISLENTIAIEVSLLKNTRYVQVPGLFLVSHPRFYH